MSSSTTASWRFTPFNFVIGFGRIASAIMLDATGEEILNKMDNKIDKVPFERLVSKTPFADETVGTCVGRVDIATAGNSVAKMAAVADGGIMLIMDDGRVSGLMMEVASADILESLGIVLSGDPSIPVRCMINDFIISDGILKTKLFLMDITDTNLVGNGNINLRDGTIDFRVTAHPKDISLLSARTPVIIGRTPVPPKPGASGRGRLEKSPILSRALTSLTAREPSSTVSLNQKGGLFFLYSLHSQSYCVS